MLKKFLLIIILILMLFIITGCNVERENEDSSEETKIQLLPVTIPDGKGHLHIVMMPRAVTKGE